MIAADTLPTGEDGDAYLLRLILHDWNNEDSIAILSSIRQAMGNAKAKLLIVEVCILILVMLIALRLFYCEV